METIKAKTDVILKELSKVKLAQDKLDIVSEFKCIPRTGKSVRIDKCGLKLPKRSLYDHIISLAEQAAIFAKYTDFELNKNNCLKLAQLICFHDVVEIMIGDVPNFSDDFFKVPDNREKQEEVANQQISEFLPSKIQKEFLETINQKPSETTKFFNMVDKIDPIIGVWRYIFLFKTQIDIEKFLNAMSDFFTNPTVKDYCTNNEIVNLVKFLQNKENAQGYFKKGADVFKRYKGRFSIDDFKYLLEKEKMNFI